MSNYIIAVSSFTFKDIIELMDSEVDPDETHWESTPAKKSFTGLENVQKVNTGHTTVQVTQKNYMFVHQIRRLSD